MENEQLLDIGLATEAKLIPASKQKRFINYIVDQIVGMLFLVGFFLLLESVFVLGLENIDPLLDQIISTLLFPIYYIFFEGLLKGKTLGKYVTGTRALTISGAHPSWGTIIKRSYSRIVPFEAFSFLGERPDGWHDRWTDTMVIDERLSSVVDEDALL